MPSLISQTPTTPFFSADWWLRKFSITTRCCACFRDFGQSGWNFPEPSGSCEKALFLLHVAHHIVSWPVVLNQHLVCKISIGRILLLLPIKAAHWVEALGYRLVSRIMKHFFSVVLCILVFQQVQPGRDDSTSCKPVTASFCQSVGYQTTRYPNGVHGFNLQQIGQIVQTACSPHVSILMCRVAVPECGSGNENRVKPCRALCEKVKKDCESTLRAKRLTWPTTLRCENLPQTDCVQVSIRHFLILYL